MGLDLLGDGKEEELFQQRRAARRKKAQAEQVSKAGNKRTAATGSTVAETGGVAEDVVSDEAPPPSSDLNAPTVDAARVSEIANRIILGEDLDEATGVEVQDRLYELASELDQIALVRVIMDRTETMAILKRASKALSEAKVEMALPNGDTVKVTPTGFLGHWDLEWLSRQLETTIHGWARISESQAERLQATADDLRTWLRYTRQRRTPFNEGKAFDVRARIAEAKGCSDDAEDKAKAKKRRRKKPGDDEDETGPEKEPIGERLTAIKERALKRRKGVKS